MSFGGDSASSARKLASLFGVGRRVENEGATQSLAYTAPKESQSEPLCHVSNPARPSTEASAKVAVAAESSASSAASASSGAATSAAAPSPSPSAVPNYAFTGRAQLYKLDGGAYAACSNGAPCSWTALCVAFRY